MKIEIQDLFFLYSQGNSAAVALRGLHLTVESGECLVINGPNGSGKSTLVKILTGFARPAAGRILFDGVDLNGIEPLRLRREWVSSIDQKGNLISELTVRENIAVTQGFAQQVGTSDKHSIESLLESYGLGALADQYPASLSASQRQICSLIAALASKPKVLIADEPTGELDDASAALIYSALQKLAGEITVILVSHDRRAESIADRVVRIRDGRISETWSPKGREKSVVDPLGWSRVKEKELAGPKQDRRVRKKSSAVLLQASHLSLGYGGKQLFTDLNFKARSGEISVLAAGAGRGKSSLLRILAGLQKPDQGSVDFMGNSVHLLDREKSAVLRASEIGFMAQGSDPLERITLNDHTLDLPPEHNANFAQSGTKKLSEFSGGERARIEILKLIYQAKPLLLLDEPTAQLDGARSEEILQLLSSYAGAGGVVIASSRDSRMLELADQVIELG